MKTQSDHEALPERPVRAAPGGLHRKDFDVEVKAVGDSGSFELYCAVFNNVDRAGDIIQPGAFANLDDFVVSGWGAVNHLNQSLPIAMVDTAVQDAKGLKITGVFHSTPEAQATRTVVAERMARGKAVKCSFGYRVLEGSSETRKGRSVYVITKLEIYEFSFVNLPANPAAEVTAVKSAGEEEVYSLKKVRGWLDGFKAGKVLSSANHKKLYGVAKALDSHGKAACGIAAEMKDFLAAHGPVDDEEEPDGDESGPDDDGDGDGMKPAKKAGETKCDPNLLLDIRTRALRARTAALARHEG